MAIASINPATGETVKTFQALSEAEIEKKLQRAVAAADINRRRSFADRASRMRRRATRYGKGPIKAPQLLDSLSGSARMAA